MNRFRTLLKLHITESFKALPQLLFGAIALMFLVSAIAFCGNEFLYNSDDAVKYNMGVVLEDDSSLANRVVDIITNMSEVQETVNFVFMDEEGAKDALNNGDVIACIIVPEDTAKGIISGKNIPMTVIFPKDSGVEGVVIKEIADSLSSMLGSAQAGIYSIYDFYESHDASKHIKEALNRMNMSYITLALSTSQMYQTENVSSTGTIPVMTYYIGSGFVLFIFLFGINCYSFTKNHIPVASKLMSLHGTPLILQSLASYTTIALSMLISIFIILLPGVFIMKYFGLSLTTFGIVSLFIIIPVLIFTAAGMIFFISSITNLTISRIMITFFTTIVMCFMAGCFIPSIMLPELINKAGHLTPAYYLVDFTCNLMAKDFKLSSLLMCILYGILFFLGGVKITYIKRGKELK